jgi:hypothetical protein
MINIFVDTSGSMSEMGKDSGTIYIVKTILDYCEKKDITVSLFKLDGSKINDLLSLKFNEQLKIIKFERALNTILISDGFIEVEEDFFDIAFIIGIDCDERNLNKISKKIFDPENVIQALEYLLFQNNILENVILNKNDEDEW